MPLELTSPAFEDDDVIPAKYGKDRENVNPPLEISGIPEDTESMVIIMEDLDADPDESLHWMIWNLPPVPTLGEEEVPEDSIEGYNDFGSPGYHGPFSTEMHEYQFHIYTLDTVLEVDEDVTRQRIEKEMAGHILDETVLTGTYQKQ